MKVRPGSIILQEGEKEIQQSHRCICIDRQLLCGKRLREVQGGNSSLEKKTFVVLFIMMMRAAL